MKDGIKQINFREMSLSTFKKLFFNSYSGFYIITLILLISSCTDDVEPTTQTIITTQTPIINIDSTDLKDLPEDLGGTHTAYPLDSTDAVFGHFVYTPSGYTDNGAEYPLLVFLHGYDMTEYTGTDVEELNEVLTGNTPPGLIHSGEWDPSFPFIVASPKLKSYWYWRHQDIHEFIKYLIDEYQVNTKRIYLTGLSLGGGGAWYYVGERGDDNYVAAIVPISGRGEERLVSNLTNMPIWAFHGDSDTSVLPYEDYGSVPLVEAINANNPEVRARVTVFNNTGHDAWSRVYQDQFTTIVEGASFNVSIYDWILQYKKE